MDPTLATLHARYGGPVPRAQLLAVRAGGAHNHDRARAQGEARLFDRLARGVVRARAGLRGTPREQDLERDLIFYRTGGLYWLDALMRLNPHP